MKARVADLVAPRGTAPLQALRSLCDLRNELDALEAQYVDAALAGGASWSDVGAALGISRQAAHKRHGGRDPVTPSPTRAAPQRDRIIITGQARRVVALAREEAARRSRAEVSSADLLLGVLIDGEGAAAESLGDIDVGLAPLRQVVASLEGPPGPGVAGAAPERLPISTEARAALEQSLREAVRLRHPHLGVEHLVLAVLRGDGTPGVAALAALGTTPQDVERCLCHLLKVADFAPAA